MKINNINTEFTILIQNILKLSSNKIWKKLFFDQLLLSFFRI